jgi:hypothetical protein
MSKIGQYLYDQVELPLFKEYATNESTTGIDFLENRIINLSVEMLPQCKHRLVLVVQLEPRSEQHHISNS